MTFDKKITLTLTERQLTEVDEAVKEDELYQSRNHYIRCAIIKLLRREGK